MSEPLPRGDLHTYDRVNVRGVEPVMPHPRLDVGTFAGMERRSLPIADDGELAVEDSEALMKCRMQMLADHARTWERGHLSHSAALSVLPWQLDDYGPFTCDRILE
jgi:hypothetical protein